MIEVYNFGFFLIVSFSKAFNQTYAKNPEEIRNETVLDLSLVSVNKCNKNFCHENYIMYKVATIHKTLSKNRK